MDELYTIEKCIIHAKKNTKKLNVKSIYTLLNKIYTNERITIDRISTICNIINKNMKQLDKLKKISIIEQRSPEWYTIRDNMITASDFAQALGHGKFGTVKDLIKKKCGYESTTFNSNCPPLKWGIMYEPIAQQIYSIRHNVEIHEFGLLQHPNIPYFGASPDGISELGVMLEIKCPYRRKIDGTVPEQYYYQIQGQLEVCDLDYCDYLECQFVEYQYASEFWSDDNWLSMFNERGIVIECNGENESSTYMYSDIYMQKEELSKWCDDMIKECTNNNKEYFIHYWILDLYSVQRINRNKEFFKSEIEKLNDTWNDVIKFRNNKNLYDNFIKQKTIKKTKTDSPFLIQNIED